MGKAQKFSKTFMINVSGTSRKSDWNKETFMEEYVTKVLNIVLGQLDERFKGLKVKVVESQKV